MTAFDNDRWEAERKARLERVGTSLQIMQTSPLERAARALAGADAKLSNGDTLYRNNPELYQRLARAVLMAVREPGADVVDALYACEGDEFSIWTDGIDAILAEPQP